ncbi:unnamed protein product, partial [Musa acuminata var. zebrina]
THRGKWHDVVLFPLRAHFSSCHPTFVVLSSCSRRSRATLAISSRESHASILSVCSSREFHASILSVGSSDLCGKVWWMVSEGKSVTFEKEREYRPPLSGPN